MQPAMTRQPENCATGLECMVSSYGLGTGAGYMYTEALHDVCQVAASPSTIQGFLGISACTRHMCWLWLGTEVSSAHRSAHTLHSPELLHLWLLASVVAIGA